MLEYLSYNGSLLHKSDFQLSITNRAFQYADGYFETIVVKTEGIPHLHFHLSRLQEAASVFRLDLPEVLKDHTRLSAELLGILKKNGLQSGLLRLTIYRREGGLFIPENNSAAYLITARSLPVSTQKRHVDFFEDFRLSESPISKFKTLYSTPYTLAGIFARENGLDDAILLSSEGHIAECIYTNIFWKTDDTYYTPSLSTGCKDGIKRRVILKQLKKQGYKVQEGLFSKGHLKSATHVFCTNVAGITPILSIQDTKYDPKLPTEITDFL